MYDDFAMTSSQSSEVTADPFSSPQTLPSLSFLSESEVSGRREPLQDFSLVLGILHRNNVAGPNWVRLQSEFNLCRGEGGEGTVYEASSDFMNNLNSVETRFSGKSFLRLRRSAAAWKECVVKRLRSGDGRDLKFQVTAAHNEIRLLSNPKFRKNPNIVKLLGWALCLDTFEAPLSDHPRLPLLILQKAEYDLKGFLESPDFDSTSYQDLCSISLGVGQGLEALHRENIVHGDIKLANVLLHKIKNHNWLSRPHACRWVPKLCDFGLADSADSATNVYKGTAGWKAPECFLGNPPISLKACDIFAYGLLVWCIFAGKSTSPVSPNINCDGGDVWIRESQGQQSFYKNAASRLRKAELAVHIAPGRNHRASFERIRPRAEVREAQLNRVLVLLRASLDDDPSRRETQPWIYMDTRRYGHLKTVTDPPAHSKWGTSRSSFLRLKEQWNLLKPALVGFVQLIRYLYLLNIAQLNKFFASNRWRDLLRVQSMAQASTKERVHTALFDEFEIINATKRIGRAHATNSSGTSMIQHGDQTSCYDMGILYARLYGRLEISRLRSCLPREDYKNVDSLGDSLAACFTKDMDTNAELRHPMFSLSQSVSTIYAFARIRSRLKLCCWRQYSCKAELSLEESKEEEPLETIKLEEEVAFTMVCSALKDSGPLSWACRGEIARAAFQQLKRKPQRQWAWLTDFECATFLSQTLPDRLVLFIEQGCDISEQLATDGEAM